FVVVPESNLARIPPEADWVEAGAMPEVFITAHDALFTRACLHMGERVLIHAAAPGVGTAAIQVAHAVGATVYGTSRTADKLERIRDLDLGLDASVAIGDTPANFVEAVQKWTNGGGVDVILDLVGGNYFAANFEALASRGRLICVGTMAGAKSEIDLGPALGETGDYYWHDAPRPLDRRKSRGHATLRLFRAPAGITRRDSSSHRPGFSRK